MADDNRDSVYEGADLTKAEIEAATKFATEKPSTSYLQRRMQIPYSHAMRLMDYLEAAGVVSPRNAAGMRTVRARGLAMNAFDVGYHAALTSRPALTELTEEQLQRAAHAVFKEVNYSTAHANFPPDSGYINAVKAVLEMFRLSMPEEAEAVINLPQGHDEPCFYCGEPCEAFAGDPGRWPLGFCQPDGTGITRWHHTRCVTTRLLPAPAAEVTGEHATSMSPEVDLLYLQGAEVHADEGHTLGEPAARSILAIALRYVRAIANSKVRP